MPSIRTYPAHDCITFLRVNEEFGGLSNMAPGYPIWLQHGAIEIKTAEALYQAMKFPNHPDVQRDIINAHSPMTAKKISRNFHVFARKDWLVINVAVMRWCLQLKAFCHTSFEELLDSTGNYPIVEISYKDTFWGARPQGSTYVGTNALGRLLMELREKIREGTSYVHDPVLPQFLLYSETAVSGFIDKGIKV